MWLQREIRLEPRPRGFHLITSEVLGALPELSELRVGLLHVLIRHTSASLIYLCEHRDRGGPRSLVATAWGE